jgi:hypothetical protein
MLAQRPAPLVDLNLPEGQPLHMLSRSSNPGAQWQSGSVVLPETKQALRW